ncbi:hypothetical protein CC1G_05548 [Coprinopsis cinerea okayama7|uniref:CBM1 domain-containing protein n=1 Tax=Coprinopsis cinerea (strain Okayama-7 / 130 / ATCC MYA-4618 / FGSC 9003) TaxID=240176 RepID=A8P1C6_COPC7|nr:hypothetical protein CC1G_05548 [Coprinopsis cinerea okayama7\|eukprot:XP_001838067.2 hypothetical protein CC1G_05548 [Coprinopsis cinerea okayama7\
MPSPRFGLVSTTLALGALLFGAARAAIPTPLPTAVDPTPSPLVPLGGQCGGITYKGPTGCAHEANKDNEAHIDLPNLHSRLFSKLPNFVSQGSAPHRDSLPLLQVRNAYPSVQRYVDQTTSPRHYIDNSPASAGYDNASADQ